jgi:hypothetical protein
MSGFSSVDDFVTSVTTNGQFWRQDFVKLVATGTAVAGNCYDLWQGNGTIQQYYHGNLVKNYDFTSSPTDWVGITGAWSYTPGTHLITRTASASDLAISQTIRMVAGCYYYCRYTIARSAGGVTFSLGGTNDTQRTAAGTYSAILVCGTTDKTVKFTADSSYAGTIDLVSVQQLAGSFLPYTDTSCEGSMWHGGDVGASMTKHLVNFGACVNAASVPNVLYLLDVLGVYPRITMTQTANYIMPVGTNSIQGAVLEDCQDDWNEQTPANTAHSLVNKVTEGVTGASANASCVKLTVSNDTFATGILASEVVGPTTNMTTYYNYAKYVYMWVRSTINLDAGDLSFCTDENASLASSQDVTLPALTANTWTRVRLDVSGVAMADRDAVISVGIKVSVDKNQAFSVYVDDVQWAMPDYVIQNGTFTGNADGWTLGAGWAYRSGDIERTAGAATPTASQLLTPVVQKCPYLVTYTVANRTAGGVTVSLGGTAGTLRETNGTFSEIITCGTTDYTLTLTASDTFDGRIDDVICEALMPRSDAGSANYGANNKFYYVMDGTISNGAQTANVDIRYTNAAAAEGTHNRSLGGTVINMSTDVVAHLPHSGVGAGKYGPFLPLQAGDTGVQSVDRLAFSGAAATAESAVNVIVCKVIASIPITTAQVYAERDLMNQLPSLPRVRDGACLQLLHLAGAVTVQGTGIVGFCDFAWS